jgi:hypothetical protein
VRFEAGPLAEDEMIRAWFLAHRLDTSSFFSTSRALSF